MHSIKNISERNKIDTLSRADTYIRRKRLISKSDYNLKSGCTYKYLWNWKKPYKPSRLGKKNSKKPKKTQKTPKNQKKTTGLGFLKKPRFFPTLPQTPWSIFEWLWNSTSITSRYAWFCVAAYYSGNRYPCIIFARSLQYICLDNDIYCF